MSGQLVRMFQDPKFLSVFIFGVVILVLYAKDKFNVPAYDKEAMGPFAHLPPESLTLDSNYRRGRSVYMVMMLSLYISICLLGPTTFPNLDLLKSAGQGQFAFGLQLPAGSSQSDYLIWPIAAATFLVSTAAANDNSMIGRVELYIRQYAHKAAYIPTAVSNLAFGLRNLMIRQWLLHNPYLTQQQLQARERALASLIGDEAVAELKSRPDDEEVLVSWGRANILFRTLKQIFNKQDEVSNARLDRLTDLQEYRGIFNRLDQTRQDLRRRFDELPREGGSDTEADKLLADIRGLAKDTSLTIAVLLSQTARNSADLNDHLDQLGFQGVQLPQRSDHLGYLILVYAFVALGVTLAAVMLYLLLPSFRPMVGPTAAASMFEMPDYFPGLATLFTGCLAYLVVFKVSDHLRDRSLEAMEWIEGLAGYVRVVLISSVLSGILSIILIILVFSVLLGGVGEVWTDLSGLFRLFMFQFVVAALGSVFALVHLRDAARVRGQTSLKDLVVQPMPYLHAGIAAICVLGISYVIAQHDVIRVVRETRATTDLVRRGVLYNEKLFQQTLKDDFSSIKSVVDQIYIRVTNLGAGDEGPPSADTADGARRTTRGSAAETVRPIRTAMAGQALLTSSETASPGDDRSQVNTLLKQLRAICEPFNRVDAREAVKAAASQGPPGPQPPPAAHSAPPTLASAPSAPANPEVLRVFHEPRRCELTHAGAESLQGNPLYEFGRSLERLHQQFESLSYMKNDPKGFRTLVYPMSTAFVVALFFGWGCRYSRGWWLSQGGDEIHREKLKERIREKYGAAVDVDRYLVTPVAALGRITPLEALRYEDYRAKLFRLVQKGQIKEFGVAMKEEAKPQDPAPGPGGAS
jgi:hypothetical protein